MLVAGIVAMTGGGATADRDIVDLIPQQIFSIDHCNFYHHVTTINILFKFVMI